MSFKESYIQYCQFNEVPLFFQPYWLDNADYSWDVCFSETDSYHAYFIYFIEKKWFHTFIRNPHLTPYSGLLCCEDNIPEAIKKVLIESLVAQLPSFDVCAIDLFWQLHLPSKLTNVDVFVRRTNLLPLQDPLAIYQQFKPSLKRQIKKAERALTIFEEDDINLFYALHQKTFVKQHKQVQIPLSVYQRYWECCKKHNCGNLLFIKDSDDHIHATLFLVYDNSISYYLAGGTDASFYGSGAMSLLMWHAIQRSKDLGKKTFDFEGSMLPNVNAFFSTFSPIETSYLQLKKVHSILYKILKGNKAN